MGQGLPSTPTIILFCLFFVWIARSSLPLAAIEGRAITERKDLFLDSRWRHLRLTPYSDSA